MKTRLLAALLAALALAGCSAGAATTVDGAAVTAGVEPPPRDADLVEAGWPEVAAWIARENAAGRPVVVNLFASWCIPCKAEAPLLTAAAEEHPEVAFLFVDHQDRRQNGAAFAREVGFDAYATVWDWQASVATAIGARGMPTTAFFTADGELAELHTGQISETDLADALAAIGA